LTTANLAEQRCSLKLFENNIEKSIDDISFESRFEKTHSASFELDVDHKRKHEKELSQATFESRKKIRKSEFVAISSNLNLKKRLKFLEDDDLFKKQKMQFEEIVSKTNILVIESLEKSTKKIEVREIVQKERDDLISYCLFIDGSIIDESSGVMC
jgi:hypothetical protein